MALQLTKTNDVVDVSKDSIVILLNTFTLNGGRVLDVSDFTPNVINAGHVIIREDATGKYKPLPISGKKFAALPEEHSYAGIQVASVNKTTQGGGVAVMVQGAVNTKAMPYDISDIEAEMKAALNQIYFTHDNN